MKKVLLIVMCAFALNVLHGQELSRYLRADPFMSEGYFLFKKGIDDVQRYEVHIVLQKGLSTGGTEETVVEKYRADKFYTQVDKQYFTSPGPGQSYLYKIMGFDKNDDVVVDAPGICAGCYGSHQGCRATCNAPDYAYSIVQYLNETESSCNFELHNATNNGSYYYFYVDCGDWGNFQQQYDPSDFGLGLEWSEYGWNDTPCPQCYDVMKVPRPAGARDVEGLPLDINCTGDVWAIRKDVGQWREPFFVTEEYNGMDPSNFCTDDGSGITATFNSDDLVQFTLAQYDLPELSCMGFLGGGGGVSWGGGDGNGMCQMATMTVYQQTTDEGTCVDVMEWSIEMVPCETQWGGVNEILSPGASVVVNHWTEAEVINVLSVSHDRLFDSNNVLSFPRKTLEAGLYEFIFLKADGTILRHFENFTEQVTLSSSYSRLFDALAFPVPVPVTDNKFSIRASVKAPMKVSFKLMDPMGKCIYDTRWDFSKACVEDIVIAPTEGLTKGVYTCQFILPDGTKETVTILVN